MIEEALEYAARGWRVFPVQWINDGKCSCGKPKCGSAGKHPLVKGGLKAATVDEKQIRSWWAQWPNANIGIQTGVFSNLVVLDIDSQEGLVALEANGYEIPETLSVKTGRGWHYYFRHPAKDLKNFAGKLAKVDLRAEGGYVVAPPSKHVSGKDYEWLNDEAELELAPAWLVEIAQRRSPNNQGVGLGLGKSKGDVAEGGRNEMLFKTACRYRSEGFDLDDLLIMLTRVNQKRCKPPVEEEELEQIAGSAMKYDPEFLTNLEAPQWQLDAVEDTLRSVGVEEQTIVKAKKEIQKTQVEKAQEIASSDVAIQLTRRTAGRGFGGVFDVALSYMGNLIPFAGISAATLIDYNRVRVAALAEGVILPDGKGAAKKWKLRLEEALEESQVITEERDPEEEPLTACMALARGWLADATLVNDVDEVVSSQGKVVLEIEGGDYVFNGQALWRYLEVQVPDAKRHHVAGAFKHLAIDRYYTPKTSTGKRSRLRRYDHQTITKEKPSEED